MSGSDSDISVSSHTKAQPEGLKPVFQTSLKKSLKSLKKEVRLQDLHSSVALFYANFVEQNKKAKKVVIKSVPESTFSFDPG